jgi:hypothetical protein
MTKYRPYMICNFHFETFFQYGEYLTIYLPAIFHVHGISRHSSYRKSHRTRLEKKLYSHRKFGVRVKVISQLTVSPSQ